MPHLVYSPSELDVLYPKLEAPEDDKLDDAEDDARDGVYQAGLRVATKIRLENQTQGRKRRPDTEEHLAEEEQTWPRTARPSTAARTQTPQLNVVESARPESTSRNPLLRRRRSRKSWAIHHCQERRRAQTEAALDEHCASTSSTSNLSPMCHHPVVLSPSSFAYS